MFREEFYILFLDKLEKGIFSSNSWSRAIILKLRGARVFEADPASVGAKRWLMELVAIFPNCPPWGRTRVGVTGSWCTCEVHIILRADADIGQILQIIYNFLHLTCSSRFSQHPLVLIKGSSTLYCILRIKTKKIFVSRITKFINVYYGDGQFYHVGCQGRAGF